MGLLSLLKFWGKSKPTKRSNPIIEPLRIWKRKTRYKDCPRCRFNVINTTGKCSNCGFDLTLVHRKFAE